MPFATGVIQTDFDFFFLVIGDGGIGHAALDSQLLRHVLILQTTLGAGEFAQHLLHVE